MNYMEEMPKSINNKRKSKFHVISLKNNRRNLKKYKVKFFPLIKIYLQNIIYCKVIKN